MHLYSKTLSAIATISPSNKSEFFLARFSCSNNFNLFHNSFGFSGKNIVEIPEAVIAGD